jgi:hypothetical protein
MPLIGVAVSAAMTATILNIKGRLRIFESFWKGVNMVSPLPLARDANRGVDGYNASPQNRGTLFPH